MRPRLVPPLVLTAVLAMAGCATHTRETLLDQTLEAYASAVRWDGFGSAMQYIDPKVLEKHPPTALQLARFQQVRVSGYDSAGAQPVSDNEVHQRVRIDLINIHTQVSRSVIDNQVWRYDPVAEHWWLESGLPDIAP